MKKPPTLKSVQVVPTHASQAEGVDNQSSQREENQAATKTNPYDVQAGILQQQILEATSTCEDCLLDAGGELDELWIEEAKNANTDGAGFTTRFELLKRLYEHGRLSAEHIGNDLASMAPHDLFFALALSDNDFAYDCFDTDEFRDDWSYINMTEEGLFYALSAAYAFMYGLRLKAQASYLH